ncbi:MAG TPA: fused MFS/spermidine synthase [Planctomycetota bacterium]|nr:fused MFS/spermidine synthase [Planctomycetota bacterium]
MKDAPQERIPGPVLAAVFLLSGFAAILYQLVWQRSLFRLLGSSSESVTMVVTAFMLGLGLGSLAGGSLSTRSRWPLPVVFGLVELGIGAFGLVSMPLFAWIASVSSEARGAAIGGIALAAVLLPTLFMGGTLPILVTYSVRRSGNVGRSVGLLYFVNTLGSALGSLAAARGLLGLLGQAGTVHLAAGVNLVVAAVVLGVHLVRRGVA